MAVHLISAKLVDDGNKRGTVKVFVPATLTLAQVQAYVSAMLPNLDVVTGAKIVGAAVNLALTLPGGLKANAIADHPISWGSNWSFAVNGSNYRHTIHVPAIDQAFVDLETLLANDPLVAPWKADIVTGDGTVAPTDEYGNDITSFLGGEISFRK
jgi:hypothetical protein